MSLTLFNSLRRQVTTQWPVVLYAASWTAFLTAMVALASFAPEMAFVSAISTSSSFSKECKAEGTVRIPLDVLGEVVCLPAYLFERSKVDLIVPPIFAALIVAGSAWVVRSIGFWAYQETR